MKGSVAAAGAPGGAKSLRAALFQFTPRPGLLEENLSKVLGAVDQAREEGAKLLVAPEMSLTGWSLPGSTDRARLSEQVESVAVPALTEAADRSGIALVVGGPLRGDQHAPTNCAIGIGLGGRRAVYRKIHLFGPERDWWEPGSRADALLEVEGVLVGLTICYDAEYPEIPRLARLAGAEVLAIPATNMSPYQRHQDLVFPTRALENECPVLLCNRVGTEAGWTYFGRSLAADAWGGVLAQAGEDQEILTVDVPVAEGLVDPELSYLARRRPEVYGRIAEARTHTESSRSVSDARGDAPATARSSMGGGGRG